ncbi:MAG: hypothetical protein ABI557_01655 [Aureliella sp.]
MPEAPVFRLTDATPTLSRPNDYGWLLRELLASLRNLVPSTHAIPRARRGQILQPAASHSQRRQPSASGHRLLKNLLLRFTQPGNDVYRRMAVEQLAESTIATPGVDRPILSLLR